MSYVTHDPNPLDCPEPDKPLTLTLNEGETVTCGQCGTVLAVVDGDLPGPPVVDNELPAVES